MDNPAAMRMARWQCCLEKLPEVLPPFGMDTKMRIVRMLVVFPASDQNAPLSLRLEHRRQGLAHATLVGKDQPASSARWRTAFRDFLSSRSHCLRTFLALPLQFIEPIVQILFDRTLIIMPQTIEPHSRNLDHHLSRIIEQPGLSAHRIGRALLQMGVT